MNNEFGYIDEKPFQECFTDKQIFSTITINDEGIEFKVNDEAKYSIFEMDKIPNEIYAVNSKLTAITAFEVNLTTSSLSAIPSSILKSNLYFIRQGKLESDEKIRHFTKKTKIRELNYYSDSLNRIFKNDSFEARSKFKKGKFVNVKVNCNKKKGEKIGDFISENNIIEIFLNKDFEYNHQYSGCEKIIIKDRSFITLKFKKGVEFNYAYKCILLLDTVIYLMTLLKRRHKKIMLKDSTKRKYLCRDMRMDLEDRKIKDRNFLICDRKDSKISFMSLFENIYKMKNESKNALFPFLEFDIKESSLEIKFLEYYKLLEYIKFKENKKIGKGKNKLFLLDILKNNNDLKVKFFGQQSEEEIEEEIRSLRNYYSHTGYYINKLPIPTEKPKRYKNINSEWLYNVLEFMKIIAYIEIYRACGINMDWKKIRYDL